MGGFNTDVQAGDDRYHVQTQVTRAGVETLVYLGGQVVYARRLANAGTDEAAQQHERIVASLEDGSLDLFVGDDNGDQTLAESINRGAMASEGILSRLGDFVRRNRTDRHAPPAFHIDSAALRRIAAEGSGTVTARLVNASGKPVAGAAVEVEHFRLLGPSTRLSGATTDRDGSVTFDCEVGDVRPVGLTLKSEWEGSEATARFLV